MADYVSVLEKVLLDNGQPVKWLRSWDEGKSWEEVDCSAFPEGRPPFIVINQLPDIDFVVERRYFPKTEFIQATGTMVNKEVKS
jgi:hypothetical protein